MANATLQSFNVFLTERLTAAVVDIYGFVEKAVIGYQEEVYRTKLENQRLQRLLDLVYKPDIRLRRADSRQIDLSSPTQEVCAQEQQIKKKCIPNEVDKEPVTLLIKEELTEPWSRSVEAAVHSSYNPTQILTVGEHEENQMPDNLIRVVTVGDHLEYKIPAQDDQSSSFGRKTRAFFCNICRQSFLKKVDLKLHLAAHAAESSPMSTEKGYSCSVCGIKTVSKSQMICHMRSHTGEKPFSCHICGNRYRLKGHITEHLRTHTGERPYACYVCGMNFYRASTMKKHAWNKHGEKMPFKCTLCDQRFPLLLVLNQHTRNVHKILYSV